MLSPIITMFKHFPLRAYSTVAVLAVICLLAFLRIREGCRQEKLTRQRGAALWLLIVYILLVLFFTVLGRRSLDYYRYNFDPGYSYRQVFLEGDTSLAPQIAVNIAMFLPVGFLVTLAAKRYGFLKGLFAGIMLTCFIEALQLLLRNGTCEIDDLISNSLGTLSGCIPGQILRPIVIHKSLSTSIQKKKEEIMNRVYLTALTNERYIPGVMALARSLHEVKAEYPLAVMIPEEKQETLGKALREYGVLDIPGTFLLPKENISVYDSNGLGLVVEQAYSHWRDSFFKLQAAGCTEYEKIILLDCDQMVVKNIDHLFSKPAFTATTCGRCVHADWLSLSAGLLVLEPSQEIHEKLLSFIIPAIEFKQSKSLQAGDQDVFNMAYPEWRNRPDLYIPEIYNICWGWIGDLCAKENCAPKDFYMIHFPGKEKPWDLGKSRYIRIFLSCLLRGKTDKLIYKTYIWRKYRLLCESK